MGSLMLIAIGAALLLMAFVFVPVMRHLTKMKASQLACVTKFYELAPKLVADDRLPKSFAEMLSMISRDIESRRIVRILLRAWVRGDIGNHRPAREQKAFMTEVNSLPDDLRTQFLLALAVGLISITYASPIGGAILRRLLFTPIGMPERTDDAPRFALALGIHAHC